MTTTSNLALHAYQPEFIANSFVGGPQMLPQVLHLSSGTYVVAYNNQNSADGYILLDFYNGGRSNSHAIATYDTLANTSAAGAPSLTQLEGGTLVVAWANHDPADLGVKVAGFMPTGEKLNSETLAFGQFTDVHVEAFDSGDAFLLTYADQNHVYARRYVDGVAWNAGAHVDQVAGNTVHGATSAVLADGGFVVAWSSDPIGPADAELHARIYNSAGFPVTNELTLDSAGGNVLPSIAALPNGNWAVAYADTNWVDENGSTGISLKILTPTGANALFGTSTIHVNTAHPLADTRPAVTVLENGFILVTWSSEVVPNSFDVYGRVFSQTGTAVTINGSNTDFLISSASGNDTFPDVAALREGQFLTAWTSTENGGQEIAANIKEIFRVTTGDDAGDTFIGDALRDVVSSGGGNDVIATGAGNDTIDAGAGNDTIYEDRGEDTIDGGAGDDTVVFSDTLDQYIVHEWGGGILVEGRDGATSQTNVLTNVEHLQFSDGTLNIVDDGNPLFDTLYYLSRNSDVFHAGVNALDHFNTFGWHEGRDPNEFFDTSGYLAINQDVAAAGINPLDHYHQAGWKEGRDPSAEFDTTLYLLRNPDVATAGMDPLAHYLQFGSAEGRSIYPAIGQNIAGGFDAEYYLWHNSDVAAAGIDPLFHFNAVGWQEGRNPNARFDTAGYLAHYTDVAAAGINPLLHYEMIGWTEGRDPSAGFDTTGYLALHPDVAAAGMNPLDHYLHFGIYEGRQAPTDGLWS